MILLFSYIAAAAVWNSTSQRSSTVDELRCLAAALAACFIYAGAVWLNA